MTPDCETPQARTLGPASNCSIFTRLLEHLKGTQQNSRRQNVLGKRLVFTFTPTAGLVRKGSLTLPPKPSPASESLTPGTRHGRGSKVRTQNGILANGNTSTKICGPYPGGFIFDQYPHLPNLTGTNPKSPDCRRRPSDPGNLGPRGRSTHRFPAAKWTPKTDGKRHRASEKTHFLRAKNRPQLLFTAKMVQTPKVCQVQGLRRPNT